MIEKQEEMLYLKRRVNEYGAYGVAATRQSVALQSRVQLPLGTQIIKTPGGVFIICPRSNSDTGPHLISC